MKFLGVKFSRAKLKVDTDVLSDTWGQIVIENGDTITVSEEVVMQVAAVYACVKLISETMATVPFFTYKRLKPEGKERDTDHDLDYIFTTKPNRWMTAVPFKERLQRDLLLDGNSYCQIIRSRRGDILELVPLFPQYVTVSIDKGKKYYTYNDGKQKIKFKAKDIYHIVAFGDNGLVGSSVLGMVRATFRNVLQADAHSNKLLENGGVLGGVLEYPNKLSDDKVKSLREYWQKMHGGARNSGKVAILQQNMKYQPLSMKASDVDLLTTRKFDIRQICRIFNVPPHKIMDLEDAHFTNIESQQTQWVVDTIRPWAVRWEDATKGQLHTYLETERTHKSEFLLDGLLRGDPKTRGEVQALGRQWGTLSSNDIRLQNNQNPIEGGDDYLVPANMVTTEYPQLKKEALEQDMKMKEEGVDTGKSLVDDSPAGSGSWKTTVNSKKLIESYSPIVTNIVGRYTRRLQKKITSLRDNCNNTDSFMEQFDNYVKQKERSKIEGEVGIVFRSFEIYLEKENGELGDTSKRLVKGYEKETREIVSELISNFDDKERFINYCNQGLVAVAESFFDSHFINLFEGEKDAE